MVTRRVRELTSSEIDELIKAHNGPRGVREFLAERTRLSVTNLLEFVGTASLTIPGTFVAQEKLVVGKLIDGITVGWVGPEFKKNFLGKIEPPRPTQEIREYKLLRRGQSLDVVTEIGEKKIEIDFGQFWEFLKTGDHELEYVAHIKNIHGVLRSVHAYWSVGELYIEAEFLDNSKRWSPGSRFLSR